MIVADTSVWIDHLAGRRTPQSQRLANAVRDGGVTVLDLVLYEVLMGVRSEPAALQIETAMRLLPQASACDFAIAALAARHYRRLRTIGISLRGVGIDLLIASYCLAHDLPLLHSDRDFAPMHAHLGLKAA